MYCLHKTGTRPLKKQQDFKKVYSQGKYAADSVFVVYALAVNPTPLQSIRLGITVSKKVGNAVTRNRIRRIAKEVYKQIYEEIEITAGYDIVIVARKIAGTFEKGKDYQVAKKSIGHLLPKAIGRAKVFCSEELSQ